MTRDEAWNLLTQYNDDPFHLHHAQVMEGVMEYFARKEGFGDEAAFWGIVGLLHDLDFGRFPDEHCVKQQEIMREHGVDSRIIRATVSHGWGMRETAGNHARARRRFPNHSGNGVPRLGQHRLAI